MATIYAFKNFNNYYNRRVKGADIKTIDDFINAFGDYSYMQTGTTDNFDYNDGVMTSHVLGRQSNPYDGECNYILVCKDNNTIDHKWFIIDQDKQCYGQYKLSLYRDVVADHWDLIKEAPMFIEKAIIPDNNPLIYNQEAISTNQIKTSETLLKDRTGCPWIVGYFARRDAGGNMTTLSGAINSEFTADIILSTPISQWSYYTYITN